MNELEAKLVAALRSGKYEQATGYLRPYSGGFCCLGVVCDIYDPDRWAKAEEILSTAASTDFVKGDETWIWGSECGFNLPSEVQKALGWKTNSGDLPEFVCGRDEYGYFPADPTVCLSNLNDEGFTFNQIADFIEAGLVLHTGE
jgi:hypothetical protein